MKVNSTTDHGLKKGSEDGEPKPTKYKAGEKRLTDLAGIYKKRSTVRTKY